MPPTRIAAVDAALGDRDQAIGWLERAIAERDFEVAYALRDTEFGALTNDARFVALARRIAR